MLAAKRMLMRGCMLGILMSFAGGGVGCMEDAKVPQLAGAWEPAAGTRKMPVGVFDMGYGLAKSNQLVVTGGARADGTESPGVWVMDIATSNWQEGPRLKEARFGHGQVTLIDGRILVTGGKQFGKKGLKALRATEILSSDLKSITTGEDLPTAMQTPTMHRLNDGRVVAVGETLACVYDPAAGAWTESIYLRERRMDHASAVMNNEKLVVVGGMSRKTIEVVDLKEKSSRLLPVRLPMTLAKMSVVKLDDDRYWIIGGMDTGTGNTTPRTWMLTFREDGKATLQEAAKLPYKRGICNAIVVRLQDGVAILSGESKLELSRMQVKTSLFATWGKAGTEGSWYGLPAMIKTHAGGFAFEQSGTITVGGGQTTHGEGGGDGGFLFLSFPRPIKEVERYTIPAIQSSND